MAGNMTDYWMDKVYNCTWRGVNLTAPTSIWIGLFLDATGDDGSGTELSGNGYVRKQIAATSPTNGIGTATSETTWTASGGSWNPITNAAAFDGSGGGANMLEHNTCTQQLLADGDTYRLAAADIDLSFN